MRIIINKDWEINNNSKLSWDLGHPKIDKKGGKYITSVTYHGTLQDALINCFRRRLLTETDDIIINCLNETEKEIATQQLIKFIDSVKEDIIKVTTIKENNENN